MTRTITSKLPPIVIDTARIVVTQGFLVFFLGSSAFALPSLVEKKKEMKLVSRGIMNLKL